MTLTIMPLLKYDFTYYDFTYYDFTLNDFTYDFTNNDLWRHLGILFRSLPIRMYDLVVWKTNGLA